jgi:RNA polymerase sigma-70 factor (ECF subfamily)
MSRKKIPISRKEDLIKTPAGRVYCLTVQPLHQSGQTKRCGAAVENQAERLARGDPVAFAELYDACADRVHHYLVLLLKSRAHADDVLQETFVRLARAPTKLAKVENLVAYVFATARNEAIRLVKRQAREGRMQAALSLESMFHKPTGDQIQAIETTEWVAASLARLSDDLREIVELKIYADLTFHEISKVTKLPQGTVATRYRSALEKMRSQMLRERE